MTKKEAIELYNMKCWNQLTLKEIAEFQLFEERLCMPFDVFHYALEKTLGRPVFIHELGSEVGKVKNELLVKLGYGD